MLYSSLLQLSSLFQHMGYFGFYEHIPSNILSPKIVKRRNKLKKMESWFSITSFHNQGVFFLPRQNNKLSFLSGPEIPSSFIWPTTEEINSFFFWFFFKTCHFQPSVTEGCHLLRCAVASVFFLSFHAGNFLHKIELLNQSSLGY